MNIQNLIYVKKEVQTVYVDRVSNIYHYVEKNLKEIIESNFKGSVSFFRENVLQNKQSSLPC